MTRVETAFDRILKLVPGYAGYATRQARRRSDSRVRARIAVTLRRCEGVIIGRLDRALTDDSTSVMELEHCRKRLNTLTDGIRYAPLGTSGLTAENRLAETELQDILSRDLDLLETVLRLNERISELPTRDILTIVDRICRALEERNEYLLEFN